MAGSLLSVNVGRAERVRLNGREHHTAINKLPVSGRVRVSGVTVAGDEQADKRDHGGREQAVYSYAIEDYEWWSRELGRELAPGIFGENLTVASIDCNNALIGERWRIGSTTLHVTGPRIPCSTLADRMGERNFARRFAEAKRFGAYMGITEEGELRAGDAIEIASRPGHGISVGTVAGAYYDDRALAAELAAVEELPPPLRGWLASIARPRARA